MTPPASSRICLWRYRENRRNYPGYHLSADAVGCDRLEKVLAPLVLAQEPLRATVRLAAEVLFSPTARARFVAPDVAPIPEH